MATALETLPDAYFCARDPTTIANLIITGFEASSSADGYPISLAPGDQRRLFLLFIASLFTIERGINNYTGQQNLLKYSESPNIDELGAFWGDNGSRPGPAPAVVTLQFTLTAVQPTQVIVPEGTQASVSNLIFSTVADLAIPAGQMTGTVTAQATLDGSAYNDWAPGQINNLVTWSQPGFNVSVTNTTTSQGGADTEEDPQYRDLLYLAPLSLAVAGPEGQYEFLTYKFNPSIIDAQVWSKEEVSSNLSDGGKVEISVILTGGVFPTSTFLSALQTYLSARNLRPLTDFPECIEPIAVPYNENFTYYVATENGPNLATIQAAIMAAVAEWELQIATNLGWNINPSALDAAVVNAGASRTTLGQVGQSSQLFNNPIRPGLVASSSSSARVVARVGTNTKAMPGLSASAGSSASFTTRLIVSGTQPGFVAMGQGQVGQRIGQSIIYGGLESGA